MGIYLLVFIISFLVVFICTPSLIRVSIRKNLTDAPGDLRKLHTRSIPTLGGVMIFAGTLFAFTLFLPTIHDYLIKGDGGIPQIGSNSNYVISSLVRGDTDANQLINDASYLIAAMLVLFFIGVKDDIIGTAA